MEDLQIKNTDIEVRTDHLNIVTRHAFALIMVLLALVADGVGF